MLNNNLAKTLLINNRDNGYNLVEAKLVNNLKLKKQYRYVKLKEKVNNY